MSLELFFVGALVVALSAVATVLMSWTVLTFARWVGLGEVPRSILAGVASFPGLVLVDAYWAGFVVPLPAGIGLALRHGTAGWLPVPFGGVALLEWSMAWVWFAALTWVFRRQGVREASTSTRVASATVGLTTQRGVYSEVGAAARRRDLRPVLGLLGGLVVLGILGFAAGLGSRSPDRVDPQAIPQSPRPTRLDSQRSVSTTEPPAANGERNLARQGVARASSTYRGYSASNVNDGDTRTTVGGRFGWANALGPRPPHWIEIDFGTAQRFDTIVLYTASRYELKDYDLVAWDGLSWHTLATVRGNVQAVREHRFEATESTRVRVMALDGPDRQSVYRRVNEIEIF